MQITRLTPEYCGECGEDAYFQIATRENDLFLCDHCINKLMDNLDNLKEESNANT